MTQLTTSLPDDLAKSLSDKANSLSISQSTLVENALRLYLLYIDKAEYAKSYQRASKDQEILNLAEEGLSEYLKNISDEAR